MQYVWRKEAKTKKYQKIIRKIIVRQKSLNVINKIILMVF